MFLVFLAPFTNFAQTTNSDGDQARISALLKEIELRGSIPPKRDTKGNVVSLYLHSHLAGERGLEAASKIHSLRELYLQGSPAKEITKEGISHLAGLTNIKLVSVGCGGELNPGVFEEICKLHVLKQLRLLGTPPPTEKEYSAITNLPFLMEFSLIGCTNFGDHELSTLTNLQSLTNVELFGTGITTNGVKVLQQLPNLTHVDVKLRH